MGQYWLLFLFVAMMLMGVASNAGTLVVFGGGAALAVGVQCLEWRPRSKS
jgi:hypothetical protein